MRPVVLAVAAALWVGCGARTGLPLPDGSFDAPPDAPTDMGVDVGPCVPATSVLALAAADLELVMDRSGSMALAIDGSDMPPPGMDRWSLLRDALAASLPTRASGTLRIGAVFFPDVPPPGDITAVTACQFGADPRVPLAPDGLAGVLSIFDATNPRGGTPTAAALTAAHAELGPARPGGLRFVLLATDGGPNCNPDALVTGSCVCTTAPADCAVPDVGVYECLDDTRTLSAISAIVADGIPVYVVGIEDPLRPDLSDFLDRMAVAGSRPRTVPGERRFYSARTRDELQAALVDIGDAVAVCTYVLPVVPPTDRGLTVFVDGVPIVEDPTGTEGWAWTDRAAGQLRLAGTACARAMRPGSVVTTRVECDLD